MAILVKTCGKLALGGFGMYVTMFLVLLGMSLMKLREKGWRGGYVVKHT